MVKCEVMGFGSRPYSFDDSKGKHLEGVTCKISVRIGEYPNDKDLGMIGVGYRYCEYKCSDVLVGAVQQGDFLFIEVDDLNTKIKSALLLDSQTGFYMPIC